ncbi:MAG: protein translocase subunit SecF [Nanoarchaeota archaeon]|nr:protein translocase subunit SecF [Nanoarchaeota archaeon]
MEEHTKEEHSHSDRSDAEHVDYSITQEVGSNQEHSESVEMESSENHFEEEVVEKSEEHVHHKQAHEEPVEKKEEPAQIKEEVVEEPVHEEKKEVHPQDPEPVEKHVHHQKHHKEPRKPFGKSILHFFDVNYKKLLIIPFVLLLLGLILVGAKIIQDGTFVEKDVSLKGGVTVTVTPESEIDALSLERMLSSQYEDNDISIRTLRGAGITSLAISSDIDGTDNAVVEAFLESVEEGINEELDDQYSIEIIGSSLGASFFRETLTALVIAFILMSIIVFIYFRSFIPSIAVILAAFSDIVVTLAIVNLMGMKLGAGGIAAFLMLIGYSVDTDMLLTTRMVKRRDGTLFERAVGAFKTGMMMNLTTMTAILAALFFVQSETIAQILTIVFIGLMVDIIFTWIQNVGILRWYLESKVRKQ